MRPDGSPWLVIGAGEILWDLLPAGKQLGGAPANFAYHASALGAEGIPLSCIGDDEPGREILQTLGELDLDERYIAVEPGYPTGTVSVTLGEGGKPAYVIHENVAWDHIPWSGRLEDLAHRADAVCFGSLAQRHAASRETLGRFLSYTRPECLRVFDVNLRQSFYSQDVLEESLRQASVFKLNDEELPVLREMFSLPAGEAAAAEDLLARFHLSVVALTRGERGSLLCSRQEKVEVAAPSVEVVDTIGAGDAFTAALTTGLLRRRSLEEVGRFASRLAGYVCTRPGGTPPVPAHFARESG